MPRLLALCVLACCLGVGCIPSLHGNEPRAVNKAVPKTFARQGAAEAAAPAPATKSLAEKHWSELFASPELRGLVEGALLRNRELSIQMQEIVIAQNEVTTKQGEYLPKVNAGAGVGLEKVGTYTSQGASDEATGLPKNLGNFTFGLTGSWEVDVWKKLRNSAKAADLRYLASIEARNFLVTQIVAEIARSYYDLLALDNKLDVLRKNVELQTSALEVVKLEKEAARVTELAVQRFEAELQKNRARVFDVEQEVVQTENRLNFLVGRYPQTVAREPRELDAPLSGTIAAGLPSQLLENRPDVRQAELELEASKLDVAAAKAAFYPSLSIDASVGYRAFNVEHLVTTPESLLYGIGGSLTAPLLNRSAITAQYRSANARQIQAVFSYEKTLLQAFTDVANQLSMIDKLNKGYQLQTDQVATLARSVDIAGVLFQSARADYVEVLLTRRDFLEAQMELVETKKRRLHAMVNVYQALGGGWRAVK